MKTMKTVRRLLSAVCAAAISAGFFGMLPVSAEETAGIRLMGDLNNDMAVAADDAQLALLLYLDGITGNADNSATAENGVADINMDGVIDAGDSQNILRYYCETLVGEQPLWAEFRDVSYQDGTGYYGHENPVFTLTGMYLEIGCASGAPGETVEVPVYVAGLSRIAGLQMFMITPDELPTLDIQSPVPDDYGIGVTTNPDAGAFVWANARDISIADGYVIATYTYQIPEDAEPGIFYPLTVDTSETAFVTVDDYWQYTLLSGVIAVK